MAIYEIKDVDLTANNSSSFKYKLNFIGNTVAVEQTEIFMINFYDQSINDSIKQYDEIRKISTAEGGDNTTGVLLDFVYFENNYRLIAADLS